MAFGTVSTLKNLVTPTMPQEEVTDDANLSYAEEDNSSRGIAIEELYPLAH